MKQLLFMLFAIATTLASAQTPSQVKYYTKQATKYTKEITDYVADILPAQQKQLFDLNYQVSQQFDSLKQLKLESNEHRKAARNIFVERDEAVKNILNSAQYDEYLMLQEEKKQEYKRKKEEQKKRELDKENAPASPPDSSAAKP